MNPTPAGFLAFVRGQGVTPAVLPDDSVFITWAYDVAVEIAYQGIQAASPTVYELMVYNLGMSNLINFAQDVPQTPPVVPPALGFFAGLRQRFGTSSLTLGIVNSASDQGTSGSQELPDFIKNLSLSDLQYVKDPYGRQYLAFAMRYGSNWGLT